MSKASKLAVTIILIYLALLAVLWLSGAGFLWMVLSFPVFIMAMAFALLSGRAPGAEALPDYVLEELRPDGVDNAGVNADLDPVEAATLLRIAPERILTMILFGLVRKGNVRITSIDPLRVELVSRKGLNYYEKWFVASMDGDSPDVNALLTCFQTLALQVADSMRLYSVGQTKDYFGGLIEDAWTDVEAVATPELAVRQAEAEALWLMIDELYLQQVSSEVPEEENGSRPLAWWYHGSEIAPKCRDRPVPMIEWPYTRPVAEYMASVSSRLVRDSGASERKGSAELER
ncbi:MAG TPA: hypothetical protein VGJ92_14180 [Methanocella sp.]|jgi:hypothetical protein